MKKADLQRLGFEEAGECVSDPKLESQVRFDLRAFSDARVIYAFSVDDQVAYIGVCGAQGTTLKSRMARYQALTGAGTNKRVVGHIREALGEKHRVSILAWNPPGQPQIRGLTVDSVKGLENSLIDLLDPDTRWNRQH